MSPEELDRYTRQMSLPELGKEGQLRLKQARVLLVGLGGLGSPAALYLTGSGVGHIGLADMDHVAEHNLHRQVLYKTSDIGRLKVEAAAEHLRELNPFVDFSLYPNGIHPDNAREVFAQYDLILDGSDRFDTRYLVNDACCLEQKPFIYASVHRQEGELCLFDPSSGKPCYRCLHPTAPPSGSVPNCAEAGVIGALCGWIGSAQANLALQHLTQPDPARAGILHLMDSRNFHITSLPITPKSDCATCSDSAEFADLHPDAYPFSCIPTDMNPSTPQSFPLEMSATDAAATLQQAGTLLDIREPDEWAICTIEGSTKIEMSQIPFKLDQLPKSGPLFIICHHGARSRQVSYFLRQRGFENAINVSGGINAWALQVDPSIPRY